METRVSSATKEILITDEGSTVLIGERITPSGKKKLAEALKGGDFDVVRTEAIAQVEAGADILDICALFIIASTLLWCYHGSLSPGIA